jgi:hypothetical protein
MCSSLVPNFTQKLTINVENTGRKVFMALNVVWVLLGRISQNLTLAGRIFVQKFNAHFSSENPPNGLIADTRSLGFLHETGVRKFSRNLGGKGKVKVKVTAEQATKAQSGNGDIALFFL